MYKNLITKRQSRTCGPTRAYEGGGRQVQMAAARAHLAGATPTSSAMSPIRVISPVSTSGTSK